jgi:hypothetical protein
MYLWKVYRTPRNNQIPSKITCTLWKSTEHQWIIKYQVKWHVHSEKSKEHQGIIKYQVKWHVHSEQSKKHQGIVL